MDKEKQKSLLEAVNDFFSKNKVEAKVVETEEERVDLVEFCKDREAHPDYKFEDLSLVDGTMITVEPAVEMGAAIVVMDAEGNPIPAPAGEYELQDGRVLVVAEDGLIAEVKEAEVEPMAEGDKEQTDKVKRIIERIESEKIFSKLEEIVTENEALKEDLKTLQETVKFLQENGEELVAKFAETQEFTKQTFEELLKEPSKEPVQKKKVRPLEKKSNKNYFIERGLEKFKKEENE